MAHALEVKGREGAAKYKQSKHLQFQPTPCRMAFIGHTGSGKSASAAVAWRTLFPLCKRWYIISPTLDQDSRFEPLKEQIIKGLRDQGISQDDPQEQPFFYNMDAIPGIIKKASLLTKQSKEAGDDFFKPGFVIPR